MGYLLKFRIPGVQRYIFQTPNLKEIRGASAIMEDLCDSKMEKDISDKGGRVWFMAAGFGAVYVESDKALKQVRSLIHRRVVARTRMLRPQFAHEPFKNDAAPASALQNLDRRLAAEPPQPDPALPLHTLFQSCQSCRRYPLVQVWDGGDTQVCGACAAKRSRLNRRGKATLPYWQKLGAFVAERQDQLHQSWHLLLAEENLAEDLLSDDESEEARPVDPDSWTETHLPSELSHIAQQSKRPGYLALIYADANQLGKALSRHFAAIRESTGDGQDKVTKMRGFSEHIDKTMRQATYGALLDTWPTLTSPFPFDILYLGGDDLLFVCAADKGPKFVQTLCRHFAGMVGKNAALRDLTLSVGLVFAKVHTPMSALVDFAKDLLKSAKTRSFQATRGDNGTAEMAGYAVDFAALTDTSVLQLKTLRRRVNGTSLTIRPCDLTSFNALLTWAAQLNQAGIGAARLRPVLEACRRSELQGTAAIQALIGRMDNKHREPLLDVLGGAQNMLDREPLSESDRFARIPWLQPAGADPPQTIVGDLIELAPFLEPSKEAP